MGQVTMTSEIAKNAAQYRLTVSYEFLRLEHVTTFMKMFTTAPCLVVELGLGLVFGWSVVMHILIFDVTVTLPCNRGRK